MRTIFYLVRNLITLYDILARGQVLPTPVYERTIHNERAYPHLDKYNYKMYNEKIVYVNIAYSCLSDAMFCSPENLFVIVVRDHEGTGIDLT